jgi:hypothetical protein
MKRRLFLLLGASTMTVTSLVGFTAVSASPAGAAPAAANWQPGVLIGYIIQCLTLDHLLNNFGVCINNAVHNIIAALPLPSSLGANAATLPKLPGQNAAPLALPGNVSGILKTLPPALQTNPVASAAPVSAPISQLIPTVKPRTSALSLPKLPTSTPINFLNAADSKAPSSSPVSATDAVAIAGIGLLGLGTVAMRRRALSAS